MKTMKMLVCLVMALLLATAPMFAMAETVYLATAKTACEIYNAGYESLGVVYEGEKMLARATGISETMYVLTSSGKTGYIYSGNLRKVGEIDSKKLGFAKKTISVYVNYGGTPLAIAKVPAGNPVLVKEVKNGVALVKTTSGYEGYVAVSWLKHI